MRAIRVLLRSSGRHVSSWRRLGKVGAAVAVACVVLHVPVLGAHLASAPLSAVFMAVLSIGCLSCARHLWRDPGVRAWVTCLVLALAMLALHTVLVGTARSHHTGHGGSDAAGWLGDPGVLLWGTSAMAAVQVLIATWALATTPAKRPAREHWQAAARGNEASRPMSGPCPVASSAH